MKGAPDERTLPANATKVRSLLFKTATLPNGQSGDKSQASQRQSVDRHSTSSFGTFGKEMARANSVFGKSGRKSLFSGSKKAIDVSRRTVGGESSLRKSELLEGRKTFTSGFSQTPNGRSVSRQSNRGSSAVTKVPLFVQKPIANEEPSQIAFNRTAIPDHPSLSDTPEGRCYQSVKTQQFIFQSQMDLLTRLLSQQQIQREEIERLKTQVRQLTAKETTLQNDSLQAKTIANNSAFLRDKTAVFANSQSAQTPVAKFQPKDHIFKKAQQTPLQDRSKSDTENMSQSFCPPKTELLQTFDYEKEDPMQTENRRLREETEALRRLVAILKNEMEELRESNRMAISLIENKQIG